MFSAISVSVFRARTVVALILLLAGTLGFRAIVNVIVAASSCQGRGSSCVSVENFAGDYLRPFLLIAAGIIFAGAAARRMRGLLSPLWLLFLAALLAAVYPLAFGIGGGWGTSYSGRILWLSKLETIPLLTLAVFTVLLSVRLEKARAMNNGLFMLKGPGRTPLGLIYGLTAVWFAIPAFARLVAFALSPSERLSVTVRLIGSPWINGTIAAELNALAGITILMVLVLETAKPEIPG